jgi:hypothetical protein
MHVVKANARMIIRMFYVALLSQRRITREHNDSNLIKGGNGADVADDDDGVHVLGLDNDGIISTPYYSIHIIISMLIFDFHIRS